MLDSNFLIEAMNGVHDKQIILAGEMLGYIEKKEASHYNRNLWTTLLVAAIIVSLFTATAYAMGWFQMSHHVSQETYVAAAFGEMELEWTGEYAFEFRGGRRNARRYASESHGTPSDDYWYPASWAVGPTKLVEGREIYNEEFGVYMPSCVVDIMYAPQFVDGGAMILLGFQPGEIIRETWGDVEVYKFQATATHAIDREQTGFQQVTS